MISHSLRSIATPIMIAVVLALSPLACTSSERAAQETFELAQFEEKQGNLEHALKLYENVSAKYPDTSWAAKAQARLAEIQLPAPSTAE